MTNNKIEIVVARFNEDIEWTKDYNEYVKIYNKGIFNKKYENLPNIGRESHTYLHHIIGNYKNLSDFTLFVQGNPFDHCFNILRVFDIIFKNDFDHRIKFHFLADRIIKYTLLNGCDHHKILPIRYLYTELFGEPNEIQLKNDITFGPGAQFLVSKKAILKHLKYTIISSEYKMKISNSIK